jgi:hypothetical protein
MALTKKDPGLGGARHGVRIATSKARILRDDPLGGNIRRVPISWLRKVTGLDSV